MKHETKPKTIVLNIFGGPGVGKSSMAYMVCGMLKFRGIRAELVTEYAKRKAWEHSNVDDPSTLKVLAAQEYIFAKQHHAMRMLDGEVDVIVTDAPLALSLVYAKRLKSFPLPSLVPMVREAIDLYYNVNVFLNRVKPYDAVGRFQDEAQAIELDKEIKGLLSDEHIMYFVEDGVEEGADRLACYIAGMVEGGRGSFEPTTDIQPDSMVIEFAGTAEIDRIKDTKSIKALMGIFGFKDQSQYMLTDRTTVTDFFGRPIMGWTNGDHTHDKHLWLSALATMIHVHPDLGVALTTHELNGLTLTRFFVKVLRHRQFNGLEDEE